METIEIRGRRVEIPGSVDELTEEQYLKFWMLVLRSSGKVSFRSVRLAWFCYLASLPDPAILTGSRLEELERYLPAVDGFFAEPPGGWSPDFRTSRNLLKEYEGYTGPGDLLSDLTFGELTQCVTLLGMMEGDDAGSTHGLSEEMARVLYHIPAESPVPPLLALHSPVYFGGVWSRVVEEPLEVNGRMIDLGILFRGDSGGRPDDNTGWLGITMEVGAAGLFGTVPEVEKTPALDVLLYLYKCRFEYLHDKNR